MQAPEAERRVVIPAGVSDISNQGMPEESIMMRWISTYRTLKLGPLPPPTLHDVVNTDLCTCELFASCFPRTGYRSSSSIAAAISIQRIVVEFVKVGLKARALTLDA